MIVRMVLLGSLALLGAVVPVFAQPAPIAPLLTWDAPAACPSGDLVDRVAGLVGLQPEHLAGKRLRVQALAWPSVNGGWRAHLRIETSSGAGERDFEAEDCASLIKGAALVIALTVDPSAASARGGQPAAAQTAPRPASTPIPPRPRFLLRPWLAAELGVLPDVSPAYGLALGVTWPALRFELEGAHQSAQSVSDDRGHSGRLLVPLSAAARACLAPWRPTPSLEPAACLAAGLTWMRSQGGSQIAFPETHDTLAVALSGGAALGWRLRDWLWLRAEASLGAMVRRPKLQVLTTNQGPADVYSVRGVTARLAGGLEFRF